MAVPNNARHNASAICVLLFKTTFALSAEPATKATFMVNLLFVLI
jgi:hypothetical protein